MKKIVLYLLLFSPVLAHAAFPPAYCKYGETNMQKQTLPPECTSIDWLTKSWATLTLSVCSAPTTQTNNLFSDKPKLEVGTNGGVGKYLLLGSQVKLKGDGDFWENGNGGDQEVQFFDSIAGYRGSDRTNFEGNAYYSYLLSAVNPSGQGQIWAINKAYSNDNCSWKEVNFQKRPFLQLNNINAPFYLYSPPSSLTFFYEMDYYSKSVQENIPAKLTIYGKVNGVSYTIPHNITSRRGTITTYPFSAIMLRDNETVELHAELNDGTYSTSFYLGTVSKTTPVSTGSSSGLPFSGYCSGATCEAPSRQCSSLGGVFSLQGSNFTCARP